MQLGFGTVAFRNRSRYSIFCTMPPEIRQMMYLRQFKDFHKGSSAEQRFDSGFVLSPGFLLYDPGLIKVPTVLNGIS